VPPFGGPSDAVVVDARVARHDEVILEAGSHAESIRLRTGDLISVAGAHVADICRD
jgi:prolyl-tRNA editing enzyme YbaK/EbsC (Cys-tRNA(Pro) deacylase)